MRKSVLKTLLLTSGVLLSTPAMAQQSESDWVPMDDVTEAPAAAVPPSKADAYAAPVYSVPTYSTPDFDAPSAAAPATKAPAQKASSKREGRRVEIVPYLEAAQIIRADLKNGGDVLTYSTIAAGVDGTVATRRAQAQVSLRYERRFALDKNARDQDVITGIARGTAALTRNFSVEAGGIAARSSVDGRGGASNIPGGNTDNVTQIYSVYAGPNFSAQTGELNINAAYRAGYAKAESRADIALPAGQRRFDQFDDSISHVATASVGAKPGMLPFGWSVNGNWKREDAQHLGSRFDSRTVRGDLTWPLSPNVAFVGGVGFEHVVISERDALRDAGVMPILGADGRFESDPNSPRLEAFHKDGLIWDAGVLWQPGPRTSVEGRFGKRYGTNTYVGSLSYRPGRDWAVGASVYDVVSGFGGYLNDSLSALPTQFRSVRNPLSGEVGGCAFGQAGASCLNDILQNASSAAFRQRGVTGTFSGNVGGWDSGLALGFNRRTLIAAQLGAQAEVDGLTDDSYFALAYLGRNIGARTRFESNVYASYIDPGFADAQDTLSTGANAALSRQIIRGLSASAAVGLDSYRQQDFDSDLIASALLGLRYSF